MNSRQRLLATIRREDTDRVPFNITYYMPGFYEAHFRPRPEQDSWEAHLNAQTRFGFDPLIGVGSASGPLWQVQQPGRWVAREQSVERRNGARLVTYVIHTPLGSLSTVHHMEGEYAGWQIEPLIKREDDLALLEHLPDAVIDSEAIDQRVRTLGDRGLGFASISGIWQQACLMRGMAQIALDLYERPRWANRFLSVIAEWLAEEIVAICRTSAETVFINESFLGMGMSGSLFEEYIRPFDQKLVHLAKAAHKLVLYHNCGRCNAVLEQTADMGIDYLEPLNPRAASGDVDPADVKGRIGDRVCLRGGFNHQLMSSGKPQDIQEEVRSCLERLAPGGGYILCPAGPVQSETPMENLVAFAEAAKRAA